VSRRLEDGAVTRLGQELPLGLGGSEAGVVTRDDVDVRLLVLVASQTGSCRDFLLSREDAGDEDMVDVAVVKEKGIWSW